MALVEIKLCLLLVKYKNSISLTWLKCYRLCYRRVEFIDDQIMVLILILFVCMLVYTSLFAVQVETKNIHADIRQEK